MRIQENYQSIKIQLDMKSRMQARLLCMVQLRNNTRGKISAQGAAEGF